LQRSEVYIPGSGIVGSISLIPLEKIAFLGPDCRDIHDGFVTPPGAMRTPFPCFWSHDASQVVSMSQKPSGCLQPLGKAKKGRHLRKTEQLWPLSSRLLVAERLRLNTHRLCSVLVSNPVLSNVWWTINTRESKKDRDLIQKALCLWINSSLGFTLMLTHREQTQGAWVKFKKPQLMNLPVPDFYALRASRMKIISVCF